MCSYGARYALFPVQFNLREHSHMTSDVSGVFLTNPNKILYCISLFSKIRYSLTYLPQNLTSYVNAPYLQNLGAIWPPCPHAGYGLAFEDCNKRVKQEAECQFYIRLFA